MSDPLCAAQPSPATHIQQLDPGCSDFGAMRQDGSYYVDKTAHFPDLLRGHGPLLLTRPRRFGKTLTLDTLRRFLELDYQNPGDTAFPQRLFAGLKIMDDPALRSCRERFMGQFPVISITLSTVKGSCYEEALKALREQISVLYDAMAPYLRASEHLTALDLRMTERCLRIDEEGEPAELRTLLVTALPHLCRMLHRAYSRPVYVLIDEYDTPLAKAWSAALPPSRGQGRDDYYQCMAELMRSMLLPLLKPSPAAQDSIARCICTGCTRVSRESLFSGANNLVVRGMDHLPTATLMGFTEEEVEAMLRCFSLEERLREARDWYDGYRFAGVRIYNPWSIASFCQTALDTPGHQASGYWAHAGINDELTACLHALPEAGLEKLQRLCEGGKVSLYLRDFFSYEDLLHRPDESSLFTLLYHTGYITKDDESSLPMWRIPNREVRECFEQQILGMYEALAAGQSADPLAAQLAGALIRGLSQEARSLLEKLMGRYLSFHALALHSGTLERLERSVAEHCEARDLEDLTLLDDRRPERVYQLYVTGVLSGQAGSGLRELVMERELGEGRADLSFISAGGDMGCVLEFKTTASASSLEAAARAGLQQIMERDYARGLYAHYPDLTRVWAYGLGCAGKRCAVVCELILPPAQSPG